MEQLKKDISLISGIAQLSTTLMGTGLFMIPAIAAGIAGHFSLWAWVLLFIAICPIALTFAQLGKRYPNAGGTAFFVRQAFNSRLESSVAWLFVSVIPVGVPAAIALAAGFLQQLLPTPINNHLFAQVLTVFLLILVNLLGTKSSGRLQTIIALSVFALVGAFLFKGEINSADLSMPTLTTESIWPITAALGVMFWCFVGIEAFAHMGEEFKNPQRDFPIAIIVGCFVAGATYWACSVVILKFGAYGSVNLYTQSLSRMVWAQAREHRPNSPLAKISRRGVPSSATVLVGAVLLASCVIGSLSKLDLEFFLKLANSIFVLVYLLAMLAAYKLLHGRGKALAAISLVLCTGVFICLGWSMLYALGIFALLSLPWKQWRQKRHSSIVE